MATLPESSVDDQCNPVHFGGYDDAMFVDPPDQASGLLCPVCILVLRDPYILSCCGKHLCKICLERVETANNPCPCCNGENFNKMLNKEKNGVILGLKVYCSNRGNGCTWTGELGDMDRHLGMKCDYALEACPYGCDQRVLRHAILKHTESECTNRPLEVQLKCLSRDMEERLRAIEMKYEKKVAVLEATVMEQEKKLNERQSMLERNIVTLEGKNTALEATIKEQEKKLNEQQSILQKNIVTLEGKNTALEAAIKKQEKKLNEQQVHLIKIGKNLKEVNSEQSCFVPASQGKIHYLKLQKDMNLFERNDGVLVTGDDKGIRIYKHAPPHVGFSQVKFLVSDTVSSLLTEIFWFPPEKEEVFRYLFGDDDNFQWKKLNLLPASGFITILHIKNKKPFTVEVCGELREGVNTICCELENFRSNYPAEIRVTHNTMNRLSFDKIVNYALSKSVELQACYDKPFNKISSLKGGKYDIHLVRDFICKID